jgi:ATP-dependent Clp endopeptidase proteolytic subunit ClpP
MKWYEIKNKADKAEVWIYDQIGEDWWTGGGVTAKNFQKELSAVKASQIDLHINSPGGEVFDGIAIYNLLKNHPATVTTYIDGIAASIASVIALAGDRVVMAENALYMMHMPSGMAMGNAETMRSFADVLDKVAGTMIGTYAAKSGKDEAEISAMMSDETWMSSDEALSAGFVDEISGKMELAACARFVPIMAKAGFKHIPEGIKEEKPTARDCERALRDVGCSNAMAKQILAGGYSASLRDEAANQSTPQPVEVAPRDVEQPEPGLNETAPPMQNRRIADRHQRLSH